MNRVSSLLKGHRSTILLPMNRVSSFLKGHGSTILLLSPLLIYMALVFAVPVGFQMAFAFWRRELHKGVMWLPVPDFSMANFVRIFTEETYLTSLAWTVGIALSTSAVAIVLAMPVAYFLARFRPFGSAFIELSFLIPIFGDIFTIYALAYAFAPQGPLNWLLMSLHLIREPLRLVTSPAAVLIWMCLPTLMVLLIRSAIAGVDVMYEEAAQTMGASWLKTIFRVTIPLAKKGIMGALLLSISGAVGIYTLPLVLIGPYNNWLSNRIQKEVDPFFNYPMASALGVILTAICGILMYLYLRTQEEGGTMRLPRVLIIILNFYALVLAFILIWPVLQMVLTSFTSDVVFPPRYFSLSAFQEVIWSSFFKALGYSLKLALWATLLLIAICLPAAYAIERRRFTGRSLMSVLIFVPTIFPSVTYVSAIGVYVFMFFTELRGTFPIIVVATAMTAIPLVVRSIQGSLATTDPMYEEAALVMGASPLQAFVKVTLPMIAPGLITAAMIAFTAASTAFTAPQLLGARERTVSMFIYEDVSKLGFTTWIAVEVLAMEAVVLGIVQTLYFVFRKQFRGLFV